MRAEFRERDLQKMRIRKETKPGKRSAAAGLDA